MIAMEEMKVQQAGTKVQPEFDELDCIECELSACIIQGGVHSTFCWNALVGYLIQLLLPVCLDKNLGVDLDEGIDDVHEGYVNHVVWSDNIWLIGKNEKEVAMMVKSLTHLMHYYGFKWKDGSTKVMRSGGYDISDEAPLQVTMQEKTMVSQWRTKTNILGSLVDDTGDTNVMVQADPEGHWSFLQGC